MTARKDPSRLKVIHSQASHFPANCLLSLIFCCLPTIAFGQWQLGLGVTDEIDGERTETASISWLSPDPNPWEFSLGFIGQRHRGAELLAKDTFWAGVNRRFYLDNSLLSLDNWFVSLGVAYAEKDDEVLSDHFQFHTGFGYRFGNRFSLSLRHLSNASISGRNRGDTFLQLHFGF